MELRLLKKDTYAIITKDEIIVTNKKGLRELYNRMVKSKTMTKQVFLAKNIFNMYIRLGECEKSLEKALEFVLVVDTEHEYDKEEEHSEVVEKLDFHGNVTTIFYTEPTYVQIMFENRYDNRDFNYLDISHDFINSEILPIISRKVKQ